MNKLFIVLAFTIGLAAAYNTEFMNEKTDSLSEEFASFVSQHGKDYATYEEYKKREEIFRINFVRMANTESNLGLSFTGKYSPLMDLTEEEFEKNYLGFNYDEEKARVERFFADPLEYKVNLDKDVPESYDWRDYGAVTDVKNQGQCGSCWAFSTTGNLEGQTKIALGKLTEISEQELVDCDKVDQGCNGGLMENAFQEIQRLGGIETEKDYPYKGRGQTCNADKSKNVIQVTSFHFVDQNEDTIKEALFKTGPLAVALNASTLQFYFGGIADPWMCNPKKLNHGVLIVGYGTENGKDYWIVKNSWGSGWGEKGYFRMIRGKGKCGINTHVVTAEISK